MVQVTPRPPRCRSASRCPRHHGCGSKRDHVPISVQIRAAGRPDIDLNAFTCAQLAAKPQADCWDDASHIRAWATEGDPGGPLSGDTVLVENVTFTGSGATPCTPDTYYARVAGTGTSSIMDADVYLDFDRRYALGGTYEADLEIDGNEYTMRVPDAWSASNIDVPLDLNEAQVNWEWRYKGPGSFEGDNCNTGPGWSPKRVGADPPRTRNRQRVRVRHPHHRQAVGRPDRPDGDIPELRQADQHLRRRTELRRLPRSRATVELRGRRLRRAPPEKRRTKLLAVCDPRFHQPSTTDMEEAFYFGCQPPYTYNSLTSDGYWWESDLDGDGETDCPASTAGWMACRPAIPQQPMGVRARRHRRQRIRSHRRNRPHNGKLSKPRHR